MNEGRDNIMEIVLLRALTCPEIQHTSLPFLQFGIQHGWPWSGFWCVFRWTPEPFCSVIQTNPPYSALQATLRWTPNCRRVHTHAHTYTRSLTSV